MIALSGLGEEALKAREQSQQVDLARSLNQIEKNTRKLGKPAPTGNLFKQGSLTYDRFSARTKQKVKYQKNKPRILMTPLSRFTIFHSSLPVEGLVVENPVGWDTVVLSLERHKDYQSLFQYFKGNFMWFGLAMRTLKTIEKEFRPE